MELVAAEWLEQIGQACPHPKVLRLSKKLATKCSFKSGADMENLCHLSYWLYIQGQPELALVSITPTHALAFDGNYRVWSFIHLMWGLECRILRESGKEAEADARSAQINEMLLTPNKLMSTRKEMESFEKKRRARFTYPDIGEVERVAEYVEAGAPKDANEWQFIGLLRLIGYTDTGLFPRLNEQRTEIEACIREYMQELAQVK
jgi:hypothetical protein